MSNTVEESQPSKLLVARSIPVSRTMLSGGLEYPGPLQPSLAGPRSPRWHRSARGGDGLVGAMGPDLRRRKLSRTRPGAGCRESVMTHRTDGTSQLTKSLETHRFSAESNADVRVWVNAP